MRSFKLSEKEKGRRKRVIYLMAGSAVLGLLLFLFALPGAFEQAEFDFIAILFVGGGSLIIVGTILYLVIRTYREKEREITAKAEVRLAQDGFYMSDGVASADIRYKDIQYFEIRRKKDGKPKQIIIESPTQIISLGIQLENLPLLAQTLESEIAKRRIPADQATSRGFVRAFLLEPYVIIASGVTTLFILSVFLYIFGFDKAGEYVEFSIGPLLFFGILIYTWKTLPKERVKAALDQMSHTPYPLIGGILYILLFVGLLLPFDKTETATLYLWDFLGSWVWIGIPLLYGLPLTGIYLAWKKRVFLLLGNTLIFLGAFFFLIFAILPEQTSEGLVAALGFFLLILYFMFGAIYLFLKLENLGSPITIVNK